MDAREKAYQAAIKFVPYWGSDAILDLPELEAYFREKFENEPSKLVAARECPRCETKDYKRFYPSVDGKHPRLAECDHCHGTGVIKRRLTRKEAEEFAAWVVEYRIIWDRSTGHYMLSSGERVSVEK